MTRRHGGPLTGAAVTALTAGAAAVIARASYAALRRKPPGGTAAWARTNHRGEPVTLLEGPAALVTAGAGAAAFGGYDDLAGGGDQRGFRGHLGALARGEVTTGAVKIGGIGVTGVVAAAAAGGSPADLIINAGLIAGGANLLNLFDLRPGRAIKVALAGGGLLAAASPAARPAAAAPLGAAVALLPEDLAERAMLGDAGANALGAMLGAAAALGLPRPARIAALAAITGLTAASEVVSFTAVIARTPALNWADMLGRRPSAAPASPASPVPQAPQAPGTPSGTEPGERQEAEPPAGAARA